MKVPFSIEESLEFGWEKTRAHSGLLFKTLLLFFLIIFFDLVVSATISKTTSLGIVFYLGLARALSFLVSVVVGIGFIVLLLKVVKGEPVTLHDLVPSWPTFVRYVASYALFGIIFFLGFGVPVIVTAMIGLALIQNPIVLVSAAIVYGIAFLFAAMYVLLRFSMLRFVAVDGDRNITSVLRRSAKVTRGIVGRLLLFMFVLTMFNIVGLLFFIVGLIVTIPVSLLAFTHVYVQLNKRAR